MTIQGILMLLVFVVLIYYAFIRKSKTETEVEKKVNSYKEIVEIAKKTEEIDEIIERESLEKINKTINKLKGENE